MPDLPWNGGARARLPRRLRGPRASAAAIAAAALLSGIAAKPILACEQPALPLIPKERNAERDQDALLGMKAYMDGTTRYVACLRADIGALGEDPSSALARSLLVRRHNAAVEEAKAVANVFADRIGAIESVALGAIVDGPALRCISTVRIRETEVIDDQTVLFHAAGGRLYVNRLETQCSGLRRNRSFVYQSRGGGHNVELCERDILTVIDPHATSCRVGRSFEITKDQAEALRKRTAD